MEAISQWMQQWFQSTVIPFLNEGTAGTANALHWIVLLPLLGAAANGLLGKRLGRANVHLIGLGAVFGAFVVAAASFYRVTLGGDAQLYELWWRWFEIGSVPVDLAFSVDRLTAVLLCVVTGVGFLIHIFSTEYMSHDESPWRFFAYLNLFIAMMSTLVLGANLVVMFVGWEGVGLASYLLIGFWYTDDQKAYAGRKAFIVNRIGDFGFILGIFSLIALFGTVDFGQLTGALDGLDPTRTVAAGIFEGWTVGSALTLAALFLFLGACGKSAQFPLYIWLPDAMAGPTPVSALIHAATMVTAGVYMTSRLAALFALSPTAMAVITVTGLFTAVLAALIAFTQNDIKKVLDYSTVSQLGIMFIGVGVGAWWAAIFHLVTHAFFKACMFLGAGSVMHGMKDETDIRKFGGLRHEMWHTWVTFMVGTIAITGVIPLSGFFSKDAILHGAHVNPNFAFPWLPGFAYVVGLTAALSTSFYMWRMVMLTFFGERRGLKEHHAHESGGAMTGPLWILAGLAVGALVWGFPRAGGSSFERLLAPVFKVAEGNLNATLARTAKELGAQVATLPASPDLGHMLPGYLIAWGVAIAGFGLAWGLYLGPGRSFAARFGTSGVGAVLHRISYGKFFVDEIYEYLFLIPLKALARVLWQVADALLIDRVLVVGTAQLTGWFAGAIRFFQNGDVQRYAAVMAVSLVALLWFFLG